MRPEQSRRARKFRGPLGPRNEAALGSTPAGARGELRLLRGTIQHREEIQADEVHDALLLRERALAPELVAEHAGGGQLGHEPAPGTRAALQRGFSAKEGAGFDESRASLRGAGGEEANCQPGPL